MDELGWSVRDGIGTILLNRPESRNAFTFEMIREWERLLRAAKNDDDVRVLVLTGAGDKAFCSGVDLASISNANPDLTPLQRKLQLHDDIHRVALALEDLDKPIIASINGVAVGRGPRHGADVRHADHVDLGAGVRGLCEGRPHPR